MRVFIEFVYKLLILLSFDFIDIVFVNKIYLYVLLIILREIILFI